MFKCSIPVVCWCLFVALESFLFAQAPLPAKEAPPSPPYSAEETVGITAELAEKESSLRAAILDEPGAAGLLYALALTLRQEGKPRESLDTYNRAARLLKPTAQELRSAALDYVLLNDYDDAIHWLELAVKMNPDDTNILYSLGRCYYSRSRYGDAARMYQRILSIQPHHLKAEENLGLVYDATNQPQQAEQALRTAAGWANKNGPDEWPYLDLGNFLLEHNRAADAIDPLRIAAAIRPGCAPCHERLGRALLDNHDISGGIAELQEATRLDPKDPKKHYELGRAFRQAGQLKRAQQELSVSQNLYAAHSQE